MWACAVEEGTKAANHLPVGSWRASYKVTRPVYAWPEHLETVDGQELRVGAHVRLLPPHDLVEEGLGSSGRWFGESGTESLLVVKAICKTCGECVELEHTFGLWHDNILQHELPEDVGCPLNHEYKCSHMGHKGKCKMICQECGS